MKFERHAQLAEGSENRFENETGSQFEEYMLPSIDSDWDGKTWRENPMERESLMYLWVKENILSKMSEEEKREVLGIPKTSQRNPRRSSDLNDQRVASAWTRLDREKRRDLIIYWCEKNQPKTWNSANPVRKTESGIILNQEMQKFHNHVVQALKELGIVDLKNESQVQLFSALHTPVDDINGIDAFYDFAGTIITLDLTKNKMKSEHGLGHEKADVAITDVDLSDEEHMDRVAKNIARAIKDRKESLARTRHAA